MAASVTRFFDIELRGEPKVGIQLFRNGNDSDDNEKWARALDESQYVNNSVIIGKKFDILQGEYETENTIPFDSIADLENTSLNNGIDEMDNWHAIITNSPSPPKSEKLYIVQKNSRRQIDRIRYRESFDDSIWKTVINRNYFIKFKNSDAPTLDRPTLSMGWAKCIYIKYSVGGEQDSPVPYSDSDILVLKTDSAEC